MSHLLSDFRYALRLLTRAPGFSATAVLVLALGIGANVGVFSVVNTLLFQPRPGRTDSLVSVYNRDRNKPTEYHGFSYPAYADLRNSGVFASVLAQGFTTLGVREGELTRQAFGAVVSANYFDTLGVALAAGRPFTLDEERGRTSTTVAIASYGVWRRHNLDPHFLGSRVRINGGDYTVVGIAPQNFGGVMAFVSPQWWLPIGAYDHTVNEIFRESAVGIQSRGNHALVLVAALEPGVALDTANARLDVFARRLGETYPATDADRTFFTGRLPRLTVSSRPQGDGPLVGLAALLMSTALLVLAISCLNLANLLLARGVARRKEIAIRQALGSGRARIVQQLVIEGLTLSLLGGVAGLIVGAWTTTMLGAWLMSAMTFGLDVLVSPSPRLIAAAGAFAVVSTVCFALGPAWSLSRPHVTEDLKGDRGGASRHRGVGPLLVAGQLAVSLALVAAAGLFTRGAINVASTDVGFPMAHQLVIGVDAGLAGYDEARTRSTYAAVLERVRGLAGVESASLASTVVFGDVQTSARVRRAPTDAGIEASSDVVTARYFETLGAGLARGREFLPAEDLRSSATGATSVVINERLAAMLFNGDDPIGRPVLVQSRPGDAPQAAVVVGVVPNLRGELFEEGPRPHVYLPFGAKLSTMMTLHVRTSPAASDGAMLGTIRRTLQAVDAQLPVLSAKTLIDQRDTSIDTWIVHAAATLFGAFGALALLLAAIGVYGLKAYDVSRRTREIGIRMALGATGADVVRQLLGEGARSAVVGLGAGLLLAIGVGKLASGFLFHVSPFDPTILAAAATVLTAAAMLAGYLPARRATRVAPLDALRVD